MGSRTKPNILVTGTPGTGKTTTCSLLADSTQLHHVDVAELVKDKGLHEGWDEEFECFIVLDHMVCKELESLIEKGGNIVDCHSCDFFPEGWFDCVVVLQTDNSVLYDRLTNRGYMGLKLLSNIECEMFQLLLEEAQSSYPDNIIMAMQSDSIEELSRNVGTLTDWVRNWRPRNQ